MIKNVFKTAFRGLKSRKAYSFINIAGLAGGISVCLAIFLIVRFEKSFDDFHSKKERIYRIITKFDDPSNDRFSSGVPKPLIRTMRQDFPQLPAIAGIYDDADAQIQVLADSNQVVRKFKEHRGVFFTENPFFSIFDYKWIAGDLSNALKEPNTAVLSKSAAEKYFGSWQAALGQFIKRDNYYVFKITGILDDPPANTDFQYKVLFSYNTLRSYLSDDWVSVNSGTMCYFIMPENLSAAQLNRMLVPFVKKYKPADRSKDLHLVQPLSEVHFDTKTGNFLLRTVSRNLLNTLQLVGLFILIIACVNFINLSTAQSLTRAKEVGVRKVLGSSRSQIRRQFLAEASVITCGAIFLSLAVVWLALPSIRTLLDIPLPFTVDGWLILFVVVCTVAVILMSGLYPAFILSGFNPITALKARVEAKSSRGFNLRRGLVVLQFVIAQGLIIGTIVVVRQMKFFDSSPLGFDKTSVITVPIPGDSLAETKIDYLKAALLQQPTIKSVSFSYASPSDDGSWFSDFNFDHSSKTTDFEANMKLADADYLATYSIPLVAGRNYRRADTAGEVVVNEEMVKRLGLTDPNQILNKQLNFWNGEAIFTVVGVIKDFHTASLEKEIVPVVVGNNRRVYQLCNIKLQTADAGETVKAIEKLWNDAFPSFVFEHRFLDQTIANFYKQERQLADLFKVFAGIAIFLSCLGLYGLASLLAVQKIKEVGIRKVLGATVTQIILLFSRDFLLLVLTAFVIAAPIAYYSMSSWLQDFAFKAPLSWWIFALGGCLTIVVALATVGYHALRAALQNPVDNLRTE